MYSYFSRAIFQKRLGRLDSLDGPCDFNDLALAYLFFEVGLVGPGWCANSGVCASILSGEVLGIGPIAWGCQGRGC